MLRIASTTLMQQGMVSRCSEMVPTLCPLRAERNADLRLFAYNSLHAVPLVIRLPLSEVQ